MVFEKRGFVNLRSRLAQSFKDIVIQVLDNKYTAFSIRKYMIRPISISFAF
jgi:hypothetical protein